MDRFPKVPRDRGAQAPGAAGAAEADLIRLPTAPSRLRADLSGAILRHARLRGVVEEGLGTRGIADAFCVSQVKVRITVLALVRAGYLQRRGNRVWPMPSAWAWAPELVADAAVAEPPPGGKAS